MDDRALLMMIQAAAASQWDTPQGSTRRDRAPVELPPDNWIRRQSVPSMDQYILPYQAQRDLWRKHPNLYSWREDVDVTPPEIRSAPMHATPIPSGEAYGGVVPAERMTKGAIAASIPFDAQGKVPGAVFFDAPVGSQRMPWVVPMNRDGPNLWPPETRDFKYYKGMPSIEKKK